MSHLAAAAASLLSMTAAASGRAAEENREHDADDVEKEGDQSDDIPSPLLANVHSPISHGASPKGKKTYKWTYEATS
jgi:hypothetical protein